MAEAFLDDAILNTSPGNSTDCPDTTHQAEKNMTLWYLAELN
jgi:hypothetical protein